MAKFRALAEYEGPARQPYRLLPFRFTPLSLDEPDEYVATNQVGELQVLSSAELRQFVGKQLDRTSRVYLDLKSKHFLIDDDSDVALDLLSLKLRTKLRRIADFTALHIFVVSLRCEHSCPYCQVSRQSDDRIAYDMSVETAEKALALAFRSPAPELTIEFQGGEPLLNFPLIRYIVERANEINGSARRIYFVIATNLALLDDEILDYCAKNSILISTSLDGPADLHNKNRPRRGNDSYQRTIAGIQRARERLGRYRVSALMTTTEASLTRVREIVDEYLARGFNSVFLRPISPYGFAVKTRYYEAYNAKRWLDFYFEGLDYIIELNKAGVFFVEYYASVILRKMLTPFETRYVDLMSPAGIGIAVAVYNYDGDVYASDEGRMLAEMGDKTFRLGSVHADSYETIFLSDKLLDPLEDSFTGSVPMCCDCAFEPFCGADPVYHHATQNDFVGNKAVSGFCIRNMAIMRRLVTLMRADESVRRIFTSWVGK